MFKKDFQIAGNIVDVLNSQIYSGTLEVIDGKIMNIVCDTKNYDQYILPGLIDVISILKAQ